MVIPTYNEAENIELVLDRVRASVPALDVLVVDDGSPDGTGELADKVAAHDDSVHVLHRDAKAGLGAAYLAGLRAGGWRAATTCSSRWTPTARTCLSSFPASSRRCPTRTSCSARGGSPAAGSSTGRGGGCCSRAAGTSTPGWRSVCPLHDATGGFRAFRRTVLEKIGLDDVTSQGYCFQVDLARRTIAAGFRVVEVPITFVEREYGESKMSGDIVREALVNVTRWGVPHRLAQVAGLVKGLRR